MWDAVYVVITLLFFAGMLWYVLGCHRLGGDDTSGDDNPAGGRRASGGERINER